jgi:cephalosporin hydroxylase
VVHAVAAGAELRARRRDAVADATGAVVRRDLERATIFRLPPSWLVTSPAYCTMGSNTSSLSAQARGWRTLRGLHPEPIDLSRIALVRERTSAELAQPAVLERLVPELGLNDEGLDEFPEALRPYCGQGLRIWQYPAQFAPYLAQLVSLGVRSYVELGVRHGGSFVATVEVLERFRPLDYAIAVDIIPCPAMDAYARLNPRIEFACVNTQGVEFAALLARRPAVDLVFIDSHHEEAQCRREFAALAEVAGMIALHDVSNVGCPGIGKVWQEVKADDRFACFEYTAQYAGMGPYMGIGLAVRKERLRGVAAAGGGGT